MTRPASRLAPAALLLCAALVIGFIAVPTQRERAYFAFAQGVQLVPPVATDVDMNVLALHDLDTDDLCVFIPRTVPGGSAKLCGPAAPGTTGAEIETLPWTAGKVDFGPLTGAQVTALRKGLLYREFTSPSPTLFPGRRGQLFPMKGVKYTTPAP